MTRRATAQDARDIAIGLILGALIGLPLLYHATQNDEAEPTGDCYTNQHGARICGLPDYKRTLYR